MIPETEREIEQSDVHTFWKRTRVGKHMDMTYQRRDDLGFTMGVYYKSKNNIFVETDNIKYVTDSIVDEMGLTSMERATTFLGASGSPRT